MASAIFKKVQSETIACRVLQDWTKNIYQHKQKAAVSIQCAWLSSDAQCLMKHVFIIVQRERRKIEENERKMKHNASKSFQKLALGFICCRQKQHVMNINAF